MSGEQWSHQLDYFLTLMGYTVGVGAIWKFPYMCARNGGGSFLLPYIIFCLIGAMPMTYLEMFIGQYSQGGPVSAWEICPPLRGVGLGSVLISWLFAIYYPVFFAWILYYLYYSFFPTLPWTQCDQIWNSPNCVSERKTVNQTLYNVIGSPYNSTMSPAETPLNRTNEISAAEDFFRNNVLGITDGLENMGSMRWPLVACLAVTIFLVYLCMINGVKLSGKIVYVTVSCPYILVLVFLVRSCILPGAMEGILFLLVPDFERLKDPNVWMEACGTTLYMVGISYGFMITMAGHNPIKNNCFRDAVWINVINLASQLFFGVAVFAITGHVAYKQGVTIDHFQTSGFKLGFITYPEAASYLPVPQMWSVFLFVMLFTLGIDSLVPSYEVVTSMFGERFPKLAQRKWLLNALVLIPSFCLGLPYMMDGGVYFLTLVEWFAFFPGIVVFAFLECIVVAWIYGIQRISKASVALWGKPLSPVVAFLWRFACPIILSSVFIYSLYSYRPPQFEDYKYPRWATWFGWMVSVMSVLPTPIILVHSIWTAPGNTLQERVYMAFRPRKRWDTHEVHDEEDNHNSETPVTSLMDVK